MNSWHERVRPYMSKDKDLKVLVISLPQRGKGQLPPGLPPNAQYTGAGPDGKLDPSMPVSMIQTTQGPQTLHEGEATVQNRDGSVTVIPQNRLKQMQDQMGIKGFETGGTYNPASPIMPSSGSAPAPISTPVTTGSVTHQAIAAPTIQPHTPPAAAVFAPATTIGAKTIQTSSVAGPTVHTPQPAKFAPMPDSLAPAPALPNIYNSPVDDATRKDSIASYNATTNGQNQATAARAASNPNFTPDALAAMSATDTLNSQASLANLESNLAINKLANLDAKANTAVQNLIQFGDFDGAAKILSDQLGVPVSADYIKTNAKLTQDTLRNNLTASTNTLNTTAATAAKTDLTNWIGTKTSDSSYMSGGWKTDAGAISRLATLWQTDPQNTNHRAFNINDPTMASWAQSIMNNSKASINTIDNAVDRFVQYRGSTLSQYMVTTTDPVTGQKTTKLPDWIHKEIADAFARAANGGDISTVIDPATGQLKHGVTLSMPWDDPAKYPEYTDWNGKEISSNVNPLTDPNYLSQKITGTDITFGDMNTYWAEHPFDQPGLINAATGKVDTKKLLAAYNKEHSQTPGTPAATDIKSFTDTESDQNKFVPGQTNGQVYSYDHFNGFMADASGTVDANHQVYDKNGNALNLKVDDPKYSNLWKALDEKAGKHLDAKTFADMLQSNSYHIDDHGALIDGMDNSSRLPTNPQTYSNPLIVNKFTQNEFGSLIDHTTGNMDAKHWTGAAQTQLQKLSTDKTPIELNGYYFTITTVQNAKTGNNQTRPQLLLQMVDKNGKSMEGRTYSAIFQPNGNIGMKSDLSGKAPWQESIPGY